MGKPSVYDGMSQQQIESSENTIESIIRNTKKKSASSGTKTANTTESRYASMKKNGV